MSGIGATSIRLWTVQPLLVWERLQSQGVLHVDPECTGYGAPNSYLWLVEQLKQRQPGYVGYLPWWAYCEKPDLRWVRHSRPAGSIEVRLELELPPEKVFIMPYWAWDRIHAGDYLAYNRQEYDQWHATWRAVLTEDEYYDSWPRPEPWNSQLHASWERLFDPMLPQMPWDGSTGIYFEAVFEPLLLQNVKRVTRFVGASKWARY